MINTVINLAEKVLNDEIDPEEFFSDIFTHLSFAIMVEIERCKNSEGGTNLNHDTTKTLQMYFTISAIYILYTIEKNLKDFKRRIEEFIDLEMYCCYNEDPYAIS